MARVRTYWKLPPCLIEPMPAGSQMDLLLAKAKPVNGGGSTTVISCLRMGKKNLVGCKTATGGEE